MRRSRVSELPQRQSLRVPLQRRTSSSESDASHPTMTKRPTADRNPKLGDRCSPRNPLVEKKLRTHISDLESQLGLVQEELKIFKEQLSSADVDKREAQEVKESNKQIPAEDQPHIQDSQHKIGTANSCLAKSPEENAICEGNLETDVFEIPLVAVPAEPKIDPTHVPNQEDSETKPNEGCSELVAEPRKPVEPLNLSEKTEVSELKVILAEKEKEIEIICAENGQLKQHVSEAAAKVSEARAKEADTALKLSLMGVELEETQARAARVTEELKAAVEAKVALDTEMKKLRIQTEQWKKAASTAASVLAGEVEMNGQRVPARSSSWGEQLGEFEVVGCGRFDSLEDFDEGPESGKRKGTGIRIFGDLWRKKGQK